MFATQATLPSWLLISAQCEIGGTDLCGLGEGVFLPGAMAAGEEARSAGDRIQTGPLSPDQYGLINPGFWMVLARIRARVEREMREKQVEVVHDESTE